MGEIARGRTIPRFFGEERMARSLELLLQDGSASAKQRSRRRSEFVFETEYAPQFIDITAQVQAAVREADVDDGIACVFSRHTTAAICINENEPCLIKDMEDFLRRIAPQGIYYRHNDFSIRTPILVDESPNAHSHCCNLLLSASAMLPVEDGELSLGTWQRVFLVELDGPRTREVSVKVLKAC
jgi:secondary thiamine-phosphate synthase enzyme